jgi:hypothetical protein
MEYLTTSQIADFNNPMAFARTRTTRVGQTEIGSNYSKTVRTNDIEESYRLVIGATEKLNTLRGNLVTMLELSESGARSSPKSRQQEETYGKLRSLSAGFDQVVEAIQFNGESIFNNKPIELSQGPGTRNLLIDPVNLNTYGEDSLQLSQSIAGASVAIEYYKEDTISNDAYDIVGLELNSAGYLPGSNPALELETGAYKVVTNYLGENSSVELRNLEGGIIEKKDNVDLSGSGTKWVDFDVGVRLEFELEHLLSTVDKHDYKSSESPDYQRSFTLTAETIYDDEDDDEIDNNAIQIDNEPSSLDSFIDLNEINYDTTNGTLELNKQYSIDIDYRGEDSSVTILDEDGTEIETFSSIDLSGKGERIVSLENGIELSFNLTSLYMDKYDYETRGAAVMNSTLNYERLDKHALRTEPGKPVESSAELIYSSPLKIEESKLNISNPKIVSLKELTQPLATGNYTVEVEYYGENSVVRLTDQLGRLQGYQFGVDLSKNGTHEVNFGNGLSIDIETDQFDTDGASLRTAIRFNRESPDIEDFDFREYADRIREALLIIDEQLLVMAEAQSLIEETNQLRNSASASSAPNSAAFNAASANLLLSGGGGGGLFGAISSGARFGVLSTQLFETTAAFQSQANQSPQELAQLSIQGNAASVLSTFA